MKSLILKDYYNIRHKQQISSAYAGILRSNVYSYYGS